jgi:hypothetical protein
MALIVNFAACSLPNCAGANWLGKYGALGQSYVAPEF